MIPVSQTHLLIMAFGLVIGWAVALELWGGLRQTKKRNEDLRREVSRYDHLLRLIMERGGLERLQATIASSENAQELITLRETLPSTRTVRKLPRGGSKLSGTPS